MDATLRAGITIAIAATLVWCILRSGFTVTYNELIGLLRRER
ncbi:hypothetical protein [Pseudoclavibacter sp. RFBA6]|nr:hypothetical protein [Pseudoclavibacter sp. RFBA6]